MFEVIFKAQDTKWLGKRLHSSSRLGWNSACSAGFLTCDPGNFPQGHVVGTWQEDISSPASLLCWECHLQPREEARPIDHCEADLFWLMPHQDVSLFRLEEGAVICR